MIPFTKLHSENRQKLIDVLPLKKPFTILIEPSSLCNFKCVHCFQSLKADSYFSRNRLNMPLERFKRIIDQLIAWDGPKLKVLKLSLFGEPLANSSFCEMLQIATESGVAERIETTTNASILSSGIAEKMVLYQLDYARISIYATNQEKHISVTDSNIDIRLIHENLRGLQEIKKKIGSEKPFVSCKMMDAYSEENEKFVAMYQDVADEVFIDKPHGWIKVDDADFIKDFYQENTTEVIKDMQDKNTNQVACPMAFTTMAIRSNGDVSPCCVDFIGGTNLGNVDKQNIKDIWNSDDWYNFQLMQLQGRNHENRSCSNCEFYKNSHYTKDNIDGFDICKLRQ